MGLLWYYDPTTEGEVKQVQPCNHALARTNFAAKVIDRSISGLPGQNLDAAKLPASHWIVHFKVLNRKT